ncbi:MULTISPECIES: divergent polysaccharide deacetylase family protein [Tatumella]|uniref:divergent polysaccharide deacetylase family protein n=1 Tax=unclassified Tatumella TaxID=2649542 RepID=UPI001BAF6038|nr:divergent polysaccharide deacetylase family protein [Tatumella sp. JGM16]MBS0893841.1 divergent polysaccharide deacetylase family protein [Tatumella sp. JGM130]MBS0913469.1 divergent polysaccharide deacetylase family protein [Tatumella sp. JGM91]
MLHRLKIVAFISGLLICQAASAAKLAIVIDDFGYRPKEENQVLQMPAAVSVAVLPDATHAREMAIKAHQTGHEVLIHLPMAPLSKQPLEKNTLTPEMSSAEITRIIQLAVSHVPYAVGLNNHMGSKMTSSLPGMIKVMQVLNHYNFYFLDSMTIGNSQSVNAAQGTSVRVLKRKVFLDDTQNDADIRKQFLRAVNLARRNGSAIAIGHPHPATVRVLQQMLADLPADITLVRPSQLLNDTPHSSASHGVKKPAVTRENTVTHAGLTAQCRTLHAPSPLLPSAGIAMIYTSIKNSQFIQDIKSIF